MAWAWFAFLSAEEGFGYFTIAGVIRAGDTGSALNDLGTPGWAYWACFAVGVAGLVFLAWRFARVGVSLSTDVDQLRTFCVWPWIAGTVISTLLVGFYVLLTPGVPSDAVAAVLIGAASLGVFAPMSMMFKGRLSYATRPPLPSLRVAGLVVIVITVVINLLLTRTPHWG